MHKQKQTQERVLDFIKKTIQEKGYPPSVREIGEAVGLKSTSTVHGHLVRLERKGLLHRDSMKPRAMEILGDPAFFRSSNVSIPVLGRVAAGTPILALENVEDYMQFPQEMLGEGEYFALIIKGESMIEAGILDGDFVVVHKQSDANNGEIVVAMIEDEATVKRYFKENGAFRLQPENQSMQPIIVSNVAILGKVISLYRRF